MMPQNVFGYVKKVRIAANEVKRRSLFKGNVFSFIRFSDLRAVPRLLVRDASAG